MVDIFNTPVKQLIVPSEVPAEENHRKLSYGVEAQPLDGFVAVDISALSAHHTDGLLSAQKNNKNLARTLSRNWKGSQKTTTDGDGNINCTATATATGGGVAGEKLDTCAHVAVGNGEVMQGHSYGHTGMATAGQGQGQGQGGKVRRLNSRKSSSQWINPRRVLFTFATVSSMGTLILLYFTLSMGKMAMEDPNIR